MPKAVKIAVTAYGSVKGGNRRSIYALVDARHAYLAKARWHQSVSGYAMASEKIENTKFMHRVVLSLKDPLLHTDHINGNKLDNRTSNLRVVTAAENQRNLPRYQKKSLLPTCVYESGRRYRARISNGRKRNGKYRIVNLGTFDTPEEAGEAVHKWKLKNWPTYTGRSRI